MADNFVNLNDSQVLGQSGQNYGGTSEDSASEARNFRGRMDASQQGLRGSAGRTFTNVANGHSGNVQLLANQIADQAVRAVRGQNTILSADDDANTAQQASMSSVEGSATNFTRPINI